MRPVVSNGKEALALTRAEWEAIGQKAGWKIASGEIGAADGAGWISVHFPIGSSEEKLFTSIYNQGIDSHLQGFTKSKTQTSNGRLYIDFHRDEIPILLRRLREVGATSALEWADRIEKDCMDPEPQAPDAREEFAEKLALWAGGGNSYVRGLSDSWLTGKDDRDAAYIERVIEELQELIDRKVPKPELITEEDIADLKKLQQNVRFLADSSSLMGPRPVKTAQFGLPVPDPAHDAAQKVLYDSIHNGDTVTIVNSQGKEMKGRATMRNDNAGCWVLNMGGPHGTPALAFPNNIVSVQKARARKT